MQNDKANYRKLFILINLQFIKLFNIYSIIKGIIIFLNQLKNTFKYINNEINQELIFE